MDKSSPKFNDAEKLSLLNAVIILLMTQFISISNAAEKTELLRCPPAADAELDTLKDLKFPPSLGVNVDPIDPRRHFRNESNTNTKGLYAGSQVQIRGSRGTLPEPYQFTSENTCNFGLFTKGRPDRTHLEPGDILVNFNPTVQQDAKSLFRNTFNSMYHSAIVVEKRGGGLEHIDSPLIMSGDNFTNNGSFHILRVRRLPREITSTAELQRWLTSSEKREELKRFLGDRKCRIQFMTDFARLIQRKGYSYAIGSDLYRKYPNKFYNALWDKELPLSFHCSELVATLYSMVGVRTYQERELRGVIDAVSTYLRNVAEKENKTFAEVAQTAARELPFEAANIRGLLRLAVELNDKFNPEASSKEFETRVTHFLTQSPERMQEIARTDPAISRLIGTNTILPSDLFNSIYNPNSDITYAGTYLEDRNFAFGNGPRPPTRDFQCP